ncbi:hypothetical protein WMY93_013152 [Mugilogobius chulae]|uniref:PDZ domain-containing protein n=1 Tax=Mugilogobius chulae TaxID=88201 RepID=A0AAW0P5L0_9GOBI
MDRPPTGDCPVEGGVVIVHQVIDGKHQRGDRLRLVNDTELHEVDPEQLATILTEGTPKLTVHKTIRKKEPVMEKPLDEDVLVPFSKEERVLSFSQLIRREEEPGQDEPRGEEDVCEEQQEQSDFLVVSMKKTTISVIKGRSCDPTHPCHECQESKCLYDEVVMVTESSSVTLVPRGSASFKCLKSNEAQVEHRVTERFISSLCELKKSTRRRRQRITIYYYKSNKRTQAMPVVLNFSDSKCFLKCCQNEGEESCFKLRGVTAEATEHLRERPERYGVCFLHEDGAHREHHV